MKTQRFFQTLTALALIAGLGACAPSKNQLKQALVDNPDILTEAIEKNPGKIMEALNKAAQNARADMAKKAEEDAAKQLEDEFKNPKKPVIEEGRAIYGSKDAPVTVIEYSDFECPYCKRGFETVQQVKEKYKDKVRIVFKHLPLSFHPNALPGAKWFEAVAMQSSDKAYKFHDLVFKNQEALKTEGPKLFERMAKEAGADVAKAKKDLENPKIMERIEADKAEAAKFEFSGTPGYLVNGVSLKGAYPFPEFEKIIDRVVK